MTAYAAPATPRPAKVRECYENAVAITPADNTQIGPFEAFVVGVGGTVTFCPYNSTTTVQITAVAGVIYPIHIQGINATGTSATGIVGLG